MTDERIKKHRAGTGNAVTDKMPNGKKCVTEGCGKAVHAKGLCTAHYRRLLRHGDAARRDQAGRKPKNPVLRSLFPEYSPRTYSRFQKAFNIITGALGTDGWQQCVERHSRSNGRLNIAAMEREAGAVLARWVWANVMDTGDSI
jgi:hypothetical protein